MATLVENINALKAVFTDIKNAIKDKGTTIPDGTPVTEYHNLITNIEGGVTDQWLEKAETLYGFFYCKPVIDFTEINIYNAWNIERMFYKCTSLTSMTINGTGIGIGSYAFYGCPKLSNVTFNCDVGSEYIPSTAVGYSSLNVERMFDDSSADVDCLNVHFKEKPYCKSMFSFCDAKNINITTDYVGDELCNFYSAFYSSSVKTVNLNGIKISSAGSMFYACGSLTTMNLDTSLCTTMGSMFYNCVSLTTVNLDTSSCTNMSGMFKQSKSLTTVNLSDTSLCTDMSTMFYLCTSLTTVNLDTSSCTNMSSMFSGCSSLTTINLDTSSCTNMNTMFDSCSSLTTITLSSVKGIEGTSSTYSLIKTFTGCTALENLTITEENSTISSIKLSDSPNLTVESMVSVFNSLATRETTPTSSSVYKGVVTLGETNLAKLTDEQKNIAYNKNWLLA